MKKLKYYGFLDSSVIKVQGDNFFRFLNVCVSLGVDFYEMKLHMQEDREEIYLCIKNRDFDKVKEASVKTGNSFEVIKEFGLLVYVRRFFSRKTFYISIIVAIIFLYSLTMFIWQVKISGCVNRNEAEILNFIKNSGVGYGVLKKNIDCDAIENAIRNEYSDVLWVSVSVKGTGLFIQIKENTYLNDKLALNEGCTDLVADGEGIVVSMVTRTGVSKVKVGDTVKEGDVLISGVKEYLNDAKEVYKTEHVYADGDVIIEYKQVYTFTYSNKIKIREYVNNKKGYNIRLFDRSILNYQPDMNDKNYEKYSENNVVVVGEAFYLPLSISKTFYKEYQSDVRVLSDKNLEQYTKVKYKIFCHNLELKGVDIIEKNATIKFNDSGCIVTAEMTLHRSCGKNVPISVEPIDEVIQEEAIE